MLHDKLHLCCVLGTRCKIPKDRNGAKKQANLFIFQKKADRTCEMYDIYDRMCVVSSIWKWKTCLELVFSPTSKLVIHSVTTMTWISEQTHSFQTVEPWQAEKCIVRWCQLLISNRRQHMFAYIKSSCVALCSIVPNKLKKINVLLCISTK